MEETLGLKTIIVKYMRRWKLFLAVFILSFIPAILYLNLYPRTYEFAASILLQEEKESGMASIGVGGAANLMKSFGIGSVGGSSVNIDDEIEILTSNRMLRLMVLNLGINVVYSEPFSFYKMYLEAPLKLTADSVTMAGLRDEIRFNVSVSPGQVRVKTRTTFGRLKGDYVFASLPATIKVGDDTFTLDFDHDGASRKSFKLQIKCLPAGWVAEALLKNIEIEDVTSASNVLLLKCNDHSQQRGLDMLNTLVRTYNADMKSYKNSEEMKTMDFVNNRIATVLSELDRVEADMLAFKKKNEMTLLEADVALYSESFKEIQTALIEGEMKAHQIDLLDMYIKDPVNKNKAIPSVFSVDEGEKGVISQYNRAIVARERLLNNSNEFNMIYQTANREVETLREGVIAMIDNARKNATKTITDLKTKENQLMSKFHSVPEKEREYINFVRNQEILNGLYLLMLQKKEEMNLLLSKQTDRARLIEPPYIKKKPLQPRNLFAAIGILALTIIVPIGYLLIKNMITSIKEEYKKNNG